MDQEGGVILFVATAVVAALVSHNRRPRDFWRACLLSATFTSIVFVTTVGAIAAIRGAPEKLILVAYVFGWFWSFVIAYLTGKVTRALGSDRN